MLRVYAKHMAHQRIRAEPAWHAERIVVTLAQAHQGGGQHACQGLLRHIAPEPQVLQDAVEGRLAV